MADLGPTQSRTNKTVGGPDGGPSPKTDHRESADNYRGELYRIGVYRVAECRDGLQWLFQRRRPRFPAGGAAWDTLGYCATKIGLKRLHRAHLGREVPELDALPNHFARRPGNG